MAKNLIIYYSRKGENYVNGNIQKLDKGNTEIVAEYIAEATDADLFEVKTIKEYDADYMKCIDEAKEELNINARPELNSYLDDVSEYDNIIVAGPCWWGTYPMAIFTQLDRLSFDGKNVFPVMTHEGSGLAGAPKALREHCKGATVGAGLAVHGGSAKNSKNEVIEWSNKNIK